MTDNILSIKNLSVAYSELDSDAISDISLTMGKGEILCVVGETGSGKSTLIRAIHGLENTIITGGEILFCDEVIGEKGISGGRSHMGSEIGLIPQNPCGSFNPLRRFDVQFREAFSGVGKKYDRNAVIKALEKIGLQDGDGILRSRPYEMSGGMNQRIAIAAAYVLGPKLLLCDEATSALDVTTAGVVVDELMALRKEQQVAILMVTHHLGIARMMADNIGVMKDGRMIEFGTADDIFKSPKMDYTKSLIKDVPRLKKDV